MIEIEFEIDIEGPAGSGVGSGGGLAAGPRSVSWGLVAGRRVGAGAGVAAVLLVAALFRMPAGLEAQSGAGPGASVQAALGVDTAWVGDVVPVVVQVPVAPGERVAWPDTLPLAGASLENAARVREWADTMPDGSPARTAAYAVTPWRTGELPLPAVAVQVAGGVTSPREVRVPLPPLLVASVLPPDTAGLEPRPPRDVLGPSWAWGRIAALLLLGALVAAGLAWWWWRRRRSALAPAPSREPAIPPRARALAALRETRESGLVERGDMKGFYTRVAEAVRDYVAALEPVWGEDLTTTELLARFRAEVGPSESAGLREVLAPADQVKFARRSPDRETALAEWETARAWVAGFDWPPPRPVTEEAA